LKQRDNRLSRRAVFAILVLAALTTHTAAFAGILTAVSSPELFATEGASQLFTVGSVVDSDNQEPPSNLSASIAWGDSTISSGAVTGGTGQFTVTGSHAYAEEGIYTPVVIVSSGASTAHWQDSALVSDGALLAGASPSLVAQMFLSSVVNLGDPINGVIATFLDGNQFGVASQFSTTVNWGDGSAVSAGAVLSSGGGEFAVGGQHTYTGTGRFPVTVGLFDIDGSSATTTGTDTVNPTPEPGSLPLAAAGLAILSIAGRHRRNAAAD
jgi:hypothetical protein